MNFFVSISVVDLFELVLKDSTILVQLKYRDLGFEPKYHALQLSNGRIHLLEKFVRLLKFVSQSRCDRRYRRRERAFSSTFVAPSPLSSL